MTTDRGIKALAAARRHRSDIVGLLQDLISIPAISGDERDRCERIAHEYRSLGFGGVFFDELGTVVARIGDGDFTILMDGHVDCVGVGDPSSWDRDPHAGTLENDEVWGRGAVDELPAVACMAYGARILRDRGLPEGVTVYLTASVMEECVEGACLTRLLDSGRIRPDVVVLGEPTDLGVARGQLGRLGAAITSRGVSAHGAHAARGVNALYKMAPIITDVERLNGRLADDGFLGPGSITVTHLECSTPSLNAVPDRARIVIDRRLTAGETVQVALEELRALPHLADATVEMLRFQGRGWNGGVVAQDEYYPSWTTPEEHPLVRGVAAAATAVLGVPPPIGRWAFSTNGVATMGHLGIPTVGFAPGREELAHTTRERVKVEDLVAATAVYSLIPEMVQELW